MRRAVSDHTLNTDKIKVDQPSEIYRRSRHYFVISISKIHTHSVARTQHPFTASCVGRRQCYCCCQSATRSRLTARMHTSSLWVYLNEIALRLRQYSVNNHTVYNAKKIREFFCTTDTKSAL